MPEQQYPPYNITYPRTLQRWLDVNSQNGPLRRIETFITIPAFDIDVNWLGYSDIVGIFNVASPNNISFTKYQDIVTNTSFALFVMYLDTDGNAVRYKLSGDGVFFFEIADYTGQFLLKNFRFEIWSSGNFNAINNANITLYTSKLGNVDYRYGEDIPLAIPSGLCTSIATAGDNNPTFIVDPVDTFIVAP